MAGVLAGRSISPSPKLVHLPSARKVQPLRAPARKAPLLVSETYLRMVMWEPDYGKSLQAMLIIRLSTVLHVVERQRLNMRLGPTAKSAPSTLEGHMEG